MSDRKETAKPRKLGPRDMRHRLKTASPTIREIFIRADDLGFTMKEVSDRSRLHRNSLYHYRAGISEPGIITVEEMARAVGYRIALVPIDGEGDAE